MKYGLFCSDFDGTLVRADGTISDKTKEEIARYTAAGGIFTVVTGRMTSSILPRVREFAEDGIVVSYQGAVVSDLRSGKILKSACFEEAEALRAVRLLEEEDHHIHVYTDEGLFVNRRDEMLEEYERICAVTGTVVEGKLFDWLTKKRPPVVKVLVMIEPEKRLALKDKLQRLLGETFFVTCSNAWLVEMMPKGQDKGSAIRFLSEYFGVPKDRIAAIGDQLNDLPMLSEAGGKFAVSNAEEELKSIATVVSSCEEDGVAEALRIAREDK